MIIASRTAAQDGVAKGDKVPKSKSAQKRKLEVDLGDENDSDPEDSDDSEDADDPQVQEEKEYESAPTAQGKFGWQDVLSCSEFKQVSKKLKCPSEPSYKDIDCKSRSPRMIKSWVFPSILPKTQAPHPPKAHPRHRVHFRSLAAVGVRRSKRCQTLWKAGRVLYLLRRR